jgi:uncharacterized membrane protein
METGEQNTNPAPQANETASTTSQPANISTGDNKTLMSVLAYIGPLVIIPFLVSKEDTFVKFHIKQGLVLLVIEIAIMVIGNMMWFLYPVIGIINIALLILSIIGIINAVQGKEKEVPFVGQFSKHVNI